MLNDSNVLLLRLYKPGDETNCSKEEIEERFLFIVALDYALRCAIVGKEEELGFTLVKQAGTRTRPVPAKMATDFNFADDIALVSDTAGRAAKLHEVEHHCGRIGQQLNAKKTEVMAYNTENTEVSTLDGKKLKVVADFKYLGSMIASSAKDIKKEEH